MSDTYYEKCGSKQNLNHQSLLILTNITPYNKRLKHKGHFRSFVYGGRSVHTFT